jgi:histidine triad (HIT) family protein
VWRDERCVAFLSIAPLKDGHTLVVPRAEIDDWLDLDAVTLGHLAAVGQTIGQALKAVYSPTKVALMAAGLEVPHVHLHLIPFDAMSELDFRNARHGAPPAELAAEAARIRRALADQGHQEHATA